MPTVSLSAPADSTIALDSVLMSAVAADNIGVEKVEFYVDGFLAGTRAAEPWEYWWVVRDLPRHSSHTILAKAYDAVGNASTSLPVHVEVNRTDVGMGFNGATDYVRLPSSSSLTSFGTQITIEAWVRLNAYGGTILASGNENEYSLVVRADGRLGVTLNQVNPPPNAEFIGKSTLSLDTWYHVAFTYNGSVESIIINGAVDTAFIISGAVSTAQYVENISVGAYSWSNHSQHNTFMNGILDEVRIWNVSRTGLQIHGSMSQELIGTEAGLVGYWKFNGNVLDSSPNGNHGAVFGAPNYVSFAR